MIFPYSRHRHRHRVQYRMTFRVYYICIRLLSMLHKKVGASCSGGIDSEPPAPRLISRFLLMMSMAQIL